MGEAQAKINDYRLEAAHLDWHSVRIQMIIGMSAIFCLCLVNFSRAVHLIESSSTLAITLNGLNIYGQLAFAFALYFASCLLTALITLEITGRFGNRLGAGCAVWSGLLFCLFPWQYYMCMPTAIFSRAGSFIILFAIFLWLRAGKKINWFIFFLGITTVTFANVSVLYFGSEQNYLLVYQSSMILFGAMLTIGISLICFPAIDNTSIRLSRAVGSVGLIVLTVFALAFEGLFASIENYKYDSYAHSNLF